MGLWFKFEGIGLGVYREIKDIDEVCVLLDFGGSMKLRVVIDVVRI